MKKIIKFFKNPIGLESNLRISVIIAETIIKIWQIKSKSNALKLVGVGLRIISIAITIQHATVHLNALIVVDIMLKVANLITEIIKFRKEQL